MATPLTKKNAQGRVYARPPEVEAEIDEVALLSHEGLKKRLAIRSPRKIGFVRSETLVHVIRKGATATSNDIVNAALMVLLERCERNLLQKVADLPTAEGLREDILGEFAEMLASDGRGEISDELDYYECRFNSAFRTLRVDRVNQELIRLERFHPVESVEDVEELFDDPRLLKEFTASLQDHHTPEARARMQQLLAAIEALPKKQREAVVLVHIMGLKEESEDAHEETAATRCGCTGRTIRNRLTSAAAKLARFQEDQ